MEISNLNKSMCDKMYITKDGRSPKDNGEFIQDQEKHIFVSIRDGIGEVTLRELELLEKRMERSCCFVEHFEYHLRHEMSNFPLAVAEVYFGTSQATERADYKFAGDCD